MNFICSLQNVIATLDGKQQQEQYLTEQYGKVKKQNTECVTASQKQCQECQNKWYIPMAHGTSV